MNKPIQTFVILLLCISCAKRYPMSEETTFKLEYKFSKEIENNLIKDTVAWKYQIAASEYATNGDYENALIHWDLAFTPKERNYSAFQIDSINNLYTKINALKYLVNEADKNQVVIINEAHHNSMHRVFTKSLLKELYEIGYKNLGLEALGNGPYLDSTLNQRKYPVQNTGFYTKDPQFGNLIRDALELGYHLFAYEATSNANGKEREIEQALNIQKEIDKKPDEKFLIHCGFDHALEGIHGSWEKAMAGRLEEYTGINPLTVDQVSFSEKSLQMYNHPFMKAFDLQQSTVLLDKENMPLKYTRGQAYKDIAILHPNTIYQSNRPTWLFSKDYTQLPISLSKISLNYPIKVLAFLKGEDVTKAVPVDIVEIVSKEDPCVLSLKKGSYKIIMTDGKKSVSFTKDII